HCSLHEHLRPSCLAPRSRHYLLIRESRGSWIPSPSTTFSLRGRRYRRAPPFGTCSNCRQDTPCGFGTVVTKFALIGARIIRSRPRTASVPKKSTRRSCARSLQTQFGSGCVLMCRWEHTSAEVWIQPSPPPLSASFLIRG